MSEIVSKLRKPLVSKDRTYTEVSDDVLSVIEKPPGNLWKICISISASLLLMGIIVVGYQVPIPVET